MMLVSQSRLLAWALLVVSATAFVQQHQHGHSLTASVQKHFITNASRLRLPPLYATVEKETYKTTTAPTNVARTKAKTGTVYAKVNTSNNPSTMKKASITSTPSSRTSTTAPAPSFSTKPAKATVATPAKATTSPTTGTSVNTDPPITVAPTDSARLAKAKRLLERLSATSSTASSSNSNSQAGDGVDDNFLLADDELVLALPASVAATATIRNSKAAAAVTPPPIVPDYFWSNGHLMQEQQLGNAAGANGAAMVNNNFVTRWARGVKVAEPLVKYDPVAAEKLLFRQPTKWLLRNFQIAWPLGIWALNVVSDYIIDVASGRTQSELSKTITRRKRAIQLTRAISNLGPAIIKGGQALASRPDLLPSEYLQELQKLQDDVPRFSNEVAFATVEQELGLPFSEVFELVQDEPVAAASIGQVYQARLKANGDLVALKIQRPDCEQVIALDLYVLRWWGGVYNRIFQFLNRDINVQSIIDDFGVLIYREIDYVAEAANAQRFNELYASVRDVFVPKIYSDFTTSKVLTMEWVDGFRLTDRLKLAQYGLDESKLVDTLVQCSLRQILENGFFHADPHAGNLLACPDGRLCYLDFGMMSYAASHQRNGFLLAVVHIVNRDWHELVRLYVKLGFIPAGTDLLPIERALERAMPDVLNADISELNFKNVINKLGDIMYTYPFSLPPFYIAIIRCLGVLEGLAIQVDPKARIISEAYPYVASRVLTDPQSELQEAFRRLAFTPTGLIRWDRLESLLEEAKESSGYDVTSALDLLTNYLIADYDGRLLAEMADQLVNAADELGFETSRYIVEAARALAINDEVAAARAFRSLQDIFASREEGIEGISKRIGDDLRDVLPELTPAMKRFRNILISLGAQSGQSDPAKFVPIIRKLSQEPRIQRAASEVIARLGERFLSRSLRAAFGLPPPVFGQPSALNTVTEDVNYNRL